MDPLETVSPIDGRYFRYTQLLAPYFSEAASMKYKIIAEGEYLIELAATKKTGLKPLSAREKAAVRNLYQFETNDAKIVNAIEKKGYQGIKATNHDFKAIEYFIKSKLKRTPLKNRLEWVHFGLTSEDASNVAYALMLAESLRDVYIPALMSVIQKIGALARANAQVPMLARTHGQPASPTTFGKEFKVFHARLLRQLETLKSYRPQAKLNGATGNYNALAIAYPKMDWMAFSKKYIAQIAKERAVRLDVNLATTQIEPHDSYAELFDCMRRVNTILIDFNNDMWRYVSDGWIAQRPVAGEVGSSTMPHKINPWFLENSEGNLGMANALFTFFSQKLPISRLQRDLSDSTVLRNIGVAFGHSLIGLGYLENQLGRIAVNRAKALADLRAHPEVVTEAIQTILRREGVAMPYEKLKALSRGKEITLADIYSFIDQLPVSPKIKKELKGIAPENYTGLAGKIARLA